MECTYPVDQSVSLSLICFSGAIQGTFLMLVERILYRPLSAAEMENQTCSDTEDMAHELAKDYLPYTIFLQVYMAIFIILYTLFFYPEMKRSKADNTLDQNGNIATEIASTATAESEMVV